MAHFNPLGGAEQFQPQPPIGFDIGPSAPPPGPFPTLPPFTPTFGGDFGGGGFSDPGGRGPGGGFLGTLAPTIPAGIPPGTAEQEFIQQQNEFIRQLLLSAERNRVGSAPVSIPGLPPDLIPIPGTVPGFDLEPIDFGVPPVAVFTPGFGGPFAAGPTRETVAARPTTQAERVLAQQQQRQLLKDILAFLAQLFTRSGGGRGGARVVSSSPIPSRSPFPSLFPSFSGAPGGAPGGIMPNVSTSFLGGFGDIISQGIETVGQVLGGIFAPGPSGSTVPQQFPQQQQFPLFPQPARPLPTRPIAQPQPVGQPGGLFDPLSALVAQGAAGAAGGACIIPTQGPPTFRLPQRVDVPTTDTSGNVRFTTYKNMGRAILFAGDFAAAKRVKKVASRARKSSGGR